MKGFLWGISEGWEMLAGGCTLPVLNVLSIAGRRTRRLPKRVADSVRQLCVRHQVSRGISQYLWFSSSVCDLIIAALYKHNKILTICVRLYNTHTQTHPHALWNAHTQTHVLMSACVCVCEHTLSALKGLISQSWKQLWIKSSGRKNLIRKMWMVIKNCLLQTQTV